MIQRLTYCYRRVIRFLVVIVLILISTDLKAQTEHTVDSLYEILATTTTPSDSIVILHNILDCSPKNRRDILYQIFETAERANDHDIMLQSVFLLASLYHYRPEFEEKFIELAMRIPESEIQKYHVLYVKLRFQADNLNRMSEKERQQALKQALKDYREADRLDKYQRLACLFTICSNLRDTTDSDLLVHYLQELQNVVEEAPEEEMTIRTLFHNFAMSVYINNGLYDKALVSIKRMLEFNSRFDKIHEAQGRVFRKYDGTLYECYHNMLVCAQELTDEEIEDYYNRILRIIDTNEAIRSNITRQKTTRIYYLMAKKRYLEAIPLLMEQLKTNKNKVQCYHFAEMLVKAARETGNKEALLYGSKRLNSIYRDRLSAKPDISISELQTIYDVEHLKTQNKGLSFENQRMEISRRQQSVVAVSVAIIILIFILIWMVSLYFRSHRLAKRLSVANKQLIAERNTLKYIYAQLIDMRDKAQVAERAKNDFVENLNSDIRVPLGAIVENSHLIAQYAQEDRRSYIREYADAMNVNIELLIRMVNDILDLPMIENGQLNIQRVPCSVNQICQTALEFVKKHVGPDITVIFPNDVQPDIIITTDSRRVEDVIFHLLSNAVKFTESGEITLDYEIDGQRKEITFVVTDTGIGIPRGIEEKIFDRFMKADPTIQGTGLGLYVGRLIATMLGGSLSLDSSYRAGAKFKFTIPLG